MDKKVYCKEEDKIYDSYSAYLNSKRWKDFRYTIIKNNSVCSVCGSEKYLQLHHLTYNNIGNETEEDVQILCKACHKIKHKRIWYMNRSVYEWWKEKVKFEYTCGHRFWCLFMLSAYAKKCSLYHEVKNPNPVTHEELEKDCLYFYDLFEIRQPPDYGKFTKKDMYDAMKGFNIPYSSFFSIDYIIYRTEIQITRGIRNGRTRKEHLEWARGKLNEAYPDGEWRNKEGRPVGSGTKQKIIQEWKQNNPDKTKADCNRETKIDPKTIRKWW